MDFNPVKQASTIKQVLSENKRHIGLLIGAGCPLAIRVVDGDGTKPLIPDIRGLTEAICNGYMEKHGADQEQNPLCKVCHALSSPERPCPTFEDFLSQVRGLVAVLGSATWNGLNSAELLEIETSMCECISEHMNQMLPDDSTAYSQLAAWVGSADRDVAIEVFTPNYDLLLEQAFEMARVPYFDGFTGTRHAFFDLQSIEKNDLPARWTRLWKVHGSINWHNDSENGVVWRGPISDSGAMIHPSHLKYEQSRRMPYLAMLDRMAGFLGEPSARLVTCGYSFRDEHLNEVIVSGLQGNPNTMAFALLYGSIANYPTARRLAESRTNLTLLAEDGAVIAGRSGEWDRVKKDEAMAVTDGPVEWVLNAAEEVEAVQFTLGDFARFGTFLREMIGNRERQTNG